MTLLKKQTLACASVAASPVVRSAVIADAPVGESYAALAVRLAEAVAGSLDGLSVALHSDVDDWGCAHVLDGKTKRFSVRCYYDNLAGFYICECVDCYVIFLCRYESKEALFADFDGLAAGLVKCCGAVKES